MYYELEFNVQKKKKTNSYIQYLFNFSHTYHLALAGIYIRVYHEVSLSKCLRGEESEY